MVTALFTHCVITLFISTVPLRHKYTGCLNIFHILLKGSLTLTAAGLKSIINYELQYGDSNQDQYV